MKKIFCAVLALAAMASCSKEYIVAEDKQAIGFGEAFVDNGTRADYSQLGKPVEAFKVYGTLEGSYGNTVQIFNGADVKKPDSYYNNTTGVYSKVAWICTAEPQYWVPNATYHFAAIVDGEAVATTTLPANINHTVADGTGNKDLLYATATASVNGNGTVTGDVTADENTLVKFQFTHLLSKLQFNAPTHNMGADYSVVVTDIKVSKVVDKGVYTVNGGTWAKADDATVNGIELDFVANDGTFETRQILPLNQALTVTINYDVYFKGTQISAVTKTGTITAQDYAKSTVYAITPKIEAKEIQFTVEKVNDWTPGTGITTPVI